MVRVVRDESEDVYYLTLSINWRNGRRCDTKVGVLGASVLNYRMGAQHWLYCN